MARDDCQMFVTSIAIHEQPDSISDHRTLDVQVAGGDAGATKSK